MFKLTLKSYTRPRKEGGRWWVVLSEVIKRDTLDDVLDALEKDFGIRPPSRMRPANTVFYDGPDGSAIPCGFVITQYLDLGDGESKQLCESWVSIHEVIEKPIDPKTYVKTKKRTETPA